MVATISPQKLAELRRVGHVDLIDVRTPVEFREVHVDFARNLPLDRLDAASVTALRQCPGDHPLYVICRSGTRGNQACQMLEASGFTQVYNVEGGTLAWDAAGLPVIRGKKAISLDRQMRIVAGSLVLLGVVLSIVAAPYWIGLSAFVGAGLIFAGITDICPMITMLSRMPWNQVKDPECAPTPGTPATPSSCCGT